MDVERWRRLAAELDALLDAEEWQRPALLEAIAATDPDFAAELERLLAEERASRSWLGEPVERFAAELVASFGESEADRAHEELAGQRIGPYRLIREIGRGGMGSVHLAARDDGQFEQRVAIKLVRADLRSASARRRFFEERRILARLEHHGIARLLDGGVADDGAPYFVLEYVDGLPLVEHAERRGLGVDERLELFVRVCAAVDYAHRNLVVHRDLKPSNVLVTASGEIKLLDFGIARMLAGEVDAPVAETRLEDRALTPEFAAPELFGRGAVTTAADVYSLGAVLYLLLSGARPFELAGASLLEAERAVVERRPKPPSQAVARGEGAAGRARARRLAGDLDAVILKALEKQPDARYRSVAELVADLERHRAGHPVHARRTNALRRAAAVVRRHRAGVAVAGVLVGLAAAGLGSTLWQARRALAEAERVRRVKDFALGLFEASDPDLALGEVLTAAEILERGVSRIDRELAGQPALQADMLDLVGDVQVKLGRYEEAAALFERSAGLRRATGGAESPELAATLVRWADSLLDPEVAEPLYREAASIQAEVLGADHEATLRTASHLGRLHFDRGDRERASFELAETLARQRRALGDRHPETMETQDALARVRLAERAFAEAERLFAGVLAEREGRLGELHSTVAEALVNRGSALDALGRLPEAEAAYRRAVAIDRKLLGNAHPELAPDLNNLSAVLVRRGSCAEAVELATEALAIEAAHRGADAPERAPFLHNLGKALACAGRHAEAVEAAQTAVAVAVELLGAESELVAVARTGLAAALEGAGRRAESAAVYRIAIAGFGTLCAEGDPRCVEAELGLARLSNVDGGPAP